MKIAVIPIFLILTISKLFSQDIRQATFRAVWVSTVKMLDYPSKKNLSAENLKQEFLEILNTCEQLNINAIIFQIRPAADAFYNSPYEPWSEWLTGKQGRSPAPYFDLLSFMIEQTHLRNIQFHAWINPFRAIATIEYADVTPNHISKTKPEWFFDYGKNRYFNPGIPQVQTYIIKIIADIVRRYNVDGIHFDDYFYPYPEKNENGNLMQLPDIETFNIYGKNFARIDDWRRNNINTFVKRVHDTIKALKPNVQFGISPTAVWRNKEYDYRGSATRGLASYDWLYADVLLWTKNKWVDYIAPQIYSYIGHNQVDFKVVLKWWSENSNDIPIYIGLNLEGIDPTRKNAHWGNPRQIPNQIQLALYFPQVKGFILYRYKTLIKNPLGIRDTIAFAFKNAVSLPVVPVSDTQTITKQVVATNPKPAYEPTIPQNLSRYFVDNELIMMWETTDNLDSISEFIIYEKKIDKTTKKDTLITIATTTNNFINLKVKKSFFAKRKYICVSTIGKNKKESLKSEIISIKVSKFIDD